MDGLNTGDIILFHTEDHWYNRLIEKVTRSPLCHSSVILRDPWCTESPLKGLYVIPSTYDGRKDVEDNQVKKYTMINWLSLFRFKNQLC